MPLSCSNLRTLERGIGGTIAEVYKKHHDSRKEIDDKIRSRLVDEIIKYIEPYTETLKMFREKGLIVNSDWRQQTIRFKNHPLLEDLGSISSAETKKLLGNLLGPDLQNMELDLTEVVNDKLLMEDLKKRLEDNGRINAICKNADKLQKEVANSYGTVKYLLTQFPELRAIFTDDDPTWKPNPNYKVKPRSAFANNDAFILLFGEAAMFGIKP